MGNWIMVVEGQGAHHNKKYEKDANRLLAKFVADMQAAGHTITRATMHHSALDVVATPAVYGSWKEGGADVVVPALTPEKYLADRDAIEADPRT